MVFEGTLFDFFFFFLCCSHHHDEGYLKQILELDISSLLITNQGRELASDLVILTIKEYGSSHTHACFDVVSHLLEKSCTNFFGVKDILYFKV